MKKKRIVSPEGRRKLSLAKQGKIKHGYTIDKSGYKRVYAPSHPNAYNGIYVLEHRLVMEQHLGRILLTKEIVHHKNGTRTDNRLCNLVLFTDKSEHAKHHYPKSDKWSAKYPKCRKCRRSDRKHNAFGLCWHCYRYHRNSPNFT